MQNESKENRSEKRGENPRGDSMNTGCGETHAEGAVTEEEK